MSEPGAEADLENANRLIRERRTWKPENMHLTASAAGLAAKWSSPPVCSHIGLRLLIKSGGPGKCLGLFYVGWPKEDAMDPVSQLQPFREKVVWAQSGDIGSPQKKQIETRGD